MDWAQDKAEKPSCALFKNTALGLGSAVHCGGVVVSCPMKLLNTIQGQYLQGKGLLILLMAHRSFVPAFML